MEFFRTHKTECWITGGCAAALLACFALYLIGNPIDYWYEGVIVVCDLVLFMVVGVLFVFRWIGAWREKTPDPAAPRDGIRIYLLIFLIMALSHAVRILLAYLWQIAAFGFDSSPLDSLWTWSGSDTRHYLAIAEHWYADYDNSGTVWRLVFLPFYVAGYNLTPARVRRFSHKVNVKLAGAAFLIIYFVLCFREREIIYPLRMLFTGRNAYAIVPIEGCTFYHRMLCYGISAVMIISIIACIPNRKVPILTHMGRNTLGVLFWHYPLVLLLWHVGAFDLLLPLGDPLWKITVLTIAVIVALILAVRIFSWPLNKLQSLIDKIPLIPCIVMDSVIMIAAIVTNILIPY